MYYSTEHTLLFAHLTKTLDNLLQKIQDLFKAFKLKLPIQRDKIK